MDDEYPPSGDADGGTESERVRFEYDWTTTSPAVAIIETVAAAADSDPEDLEPLYDWVDPDAIDALFEDSSDTPHRSRLFVSFTYAGYEVTIGEDGVTTAQPHEPV